MTRREAILCGLTSALPDDSTARLLEREFSEPGLSYLLMRIPGRRVIALRWLDVEQAVPLGSLVKPLAAYAHGRPFPEVTCREHGRLTLPMAVAYSCNTYFLAMARELNGSKLAELGVPAPLAPTPETWIGLGDAWRISPLAIAHGYCELLLRAPREILEGMRLSAKLGTAREMHCDAYAKTGTAQCRHARRNPGDGYALALYPASDPRLALLTSLDGAPGSHAAKVCGEMLRRIS